MKKKVRKYSIRYKILIPISVLILLICALLGYNGYNRVKTGMISLGIEQASMAVNLAASVIDGDEIAAIREGSEEAEEYNNQLEALRNMQEITGIKFIYTL